MDLSLNEILHYDRYFMSYSKKRKSTWDLGSVSSQSDSKRLKSQSYVAARPKPNGGRAPRIKGSVAPYGGRRELKYVDQPDATYVADTTGSVTLLNGLAIGTDNNTREGRQSTVKSVQIKGFASANSAAITPQKVRMILVWDNAVNSGSNPTISNVLTVVGANAFPLVDNAQRFTILWDKSMILGLRTATAGEQMVEEIDYYRKLDSITQYSGTGATAGSIQNGGLFLLTLGSQAASATLAAAFQLSIRVRFVDN